MTDTDNTVDGMFTEEEFLQHMGITADMDEDDVIAHYGRKGMKWGQKMAEANLGVAAKARTSTGNDKTRSAGRAERNAAIDSARERIKTGENRKNYLDAKQNYKAAKHTEGQAAAKAALRAVKDKNADDYHDSNLSKSGSEAVKDTLSVVASVALAAALMASAR